MTDVSGETAPVTGAEWKRQRVLELLDGALVPGNVERLKSYVAPTCRIVFPGFETAGHEGVDQLMALIGELFDGCPTKSYDLWVIDDMGVNVHGVLYGRFQDGRSMDGTRYTDTFIFNGEGLITHWLVFNDLALLPE